MPTYRSNKISSPIIKISDVADQPTIGAVSEGTSFDQLNIAFTPATTGGRSFKAVSNPGGIVGQSSSSPIPVRGLIPGTNYTFTVSGSSGGVASSASITNSATGALVPIATTTNSSIANITFSNIPQTYAHLMLIAHTNTQQAGSPADVARLQLNGGAIGLSSVVMNADGASVNTIREATTGAGGYLGTRPAFATNLYGNIVSYFLNYKNTTAFKTVLSRSTSDGNGSGGTQLSAMLWQSTAAITSLTFAGTGNFPGVGTRLTLYGIKDIS